jgi:uncharacterized protein YqhQ
VPPEKPREELQVGGQAVIEGVVMRTADRWALAVRRPAGDIFISVNPVLTLAQKHQRWNVFPFRGMMALADSLIIGVKALSISGGISLEDYDEEQEAARERELDSGEGEPVSGESAEAEGEPAPADGGTEETKPIAGIHIAIAMVIALALFLGLFIVLPAVLAKQFDSVIHNTVVYNLIEGGIRVAIFILYLVAMSLMPDIRRVFAYHGAEHKVVHAYEAGRPLTPEEASKFTTAHMRCGTAFLLIVFVMSILVFSLMGRPDLWLRIVERLIIIPFVAAFSYEIIKFAGRHEDSRVVKIVMAPGLLLQKLTTRQPDDSQLEVAIEALEAAIGAGELQEAEG